MTYGPMLYHDDSASRKEMPLYRGCLRYFPAALALVSALSRKGNDKHNPGEEMHHARAKSTDHGDCILRHQADVGKLDPDTDFDHAVAVAWRALAQLQELAERCYGWPVAPAARFPEPPDNAWRPVTDADVVAHKLSVVKVADAQVHVSGRAFVEHNGEKVRRWWAYVDGRILPCLFYAETDAKAAAERALVDSPTPRSSPRGPNWRPAVVTDLRAPLAFSGRTAIELGDCFTHKSGRVGVESGLGIDRPWFVVTDAGWTGGHGYRTRDDAMRAAEAWLEGAGA